MSYIITSINKFDYNSADHCLNSLGTTYKAGPYMARIDTAIVACNKWSAAFSIDLPPTHTLRGFILLNEDSYLFNSQKEAYNAAGRDLISYLNRWNFTGDYDNLIKCIDPEAFSYSQSTVNKPVELVPLEKKQLTLF